MSETQPLAVPTVPQHPVPYMRVRKQVWREFLAKGGAMTIVVDPIADQLATAPTTVSGTITVDVALPKPFTMQVQLGRSTATVKTVVPNQTTGRFTVTFPANSLPLGSANAKVSSTVSPDFATSNNFVVT